MLVKALFKALAYRTLDWRGILETGAGFLTLMIKQIIDRLKVTFVHLRTIVNRRDVLRDVLILIGLSLLFHGLYLLYPWLSYTVLGILILLGGFFMGE